MPCCLLLFAAQGLTAGVSPDVLESMRLLVETVMGGMGNRCGEQNGSSTSARLYAYLNRRAGEPVAVFAAAI